MYSVAVRVMLKDGISDPQGQTIEKALPALGFDGISGVRVGKLITLSLDANDQDDAYRQAVEMCDRLLANPVIESYEVSVS
jgi:phosphoribosylformylglycinamidine synthase subunit PurS